MYVPGCIALHVGFEDLEGVVAAAAKSRLGRLPVDHLPDVLHVRRLAVEVLQVVGVLPHVHAEERGVAHHDGLLVGQRHDSQLSGVGFLYKPLTACQVSNGFDG